MRNIIIATHGCLARGFEDALRIIVGKKDNITAYSCYTEEDIDFVSLIEEQIKKDASADYVIFTDLLGGSVNTNLFFLANQYEYVHVVTGTNLSLILSVALSLEPNTENLIKTSICEAKESMVYCNQYIKE